MVGIQTSSEPGHNKLLAALPKREFQRLSALFEPVELRFDQILFQPGQVIPHVYFPLSGIVSLLLVLEDGPVAEVSRVGNEGMIGMPVFFGVSTSQTRAFVQVRGQALRLTVHAFRREAKPGGTLSGILLRYAQALMGHAERLTACNIWHSVEQRLCRWLLVTQDRLQTELIEVTQEFLSQMLGAHRQSVTVAARNLQSAGLIRYSRGKLNILDRDGLEEASCPCYRAIREHFDHLLAEIGG